MSVSLYRKYRPQSFGEVYGQKSAIDIITNSIARDRVGHAYLFSGSRGCGKTSVARIFAKALNCLERQNNQSFEPCGHCSNCLSITQGESLDVIEIDGASNNGVDNIRDLKENVTLAPFTSKYKIYIVDEVHMLSQGAFNALLKTLEEPPAHVIFILATTEPHKVPVTIRSRCQHIPFHTITPQDIYKRLEEVCKQENFIFEPEALWEIARQADGAMRDALSLLEQVTAAGDITLGNVEVSFGTGSRSAFERWLTSLRTSPEAAYEILKSMFEAGASGVRVFEEIFALTSDLWLVARWPKIIDTLGGSEPEKKFLREEAIQWKPERLHYILNVANKILIQARMGARNDILLGMFFMLLEPVHMPEFSPTLEPQQNVSLPASPSNNMQVPETPPKEEATAPKAALAIDDKPNVVEFDEKFQEKILERTHEADFWIYCGMFNARPYEKENNLILDITAFYAYDYLRQERNSSKIAQIFSEYSKVILTFEGNQHECKIFENQKSEPHQPQVQNQAHQEQEMIPVKDELPPEEFQYVDPGEEPENETRQNDIDKNSAFYRFIRELNALGMRSEMLLIKHDEPEDDEDEENEMSLDLEAESDNDE